MEPESTLLVDPEHKFEEKLLQDLAMESGAAAASIIRMSRSGRNNRQGQGLLFEQVAKFLHPEVPRTRWLRKGDEFYNRDENWGITGMALQGHSIVDVTDINPDPHGEWYGEIIRPREKIRIKRSYCEISDLIGAPLSDMLIVPVQSHNIVMGAIKLLNHSHCRHCQQGGFQAHHVDAAREAEKLAAHWLDSYPVRCEVVSVFIDVTDSTSFLIASGYNDGARVFQLFANEIQKEIEHIASALKGKREDKYATKYGGVPFLDKFTGDGVLVIVPYDRNPLPESENIESLYIKPNVLKILKAAKKAWSDILGSQECRRVLREAAMPREPLKIAISSGPAYIGRFGGNLSALGRPLIEAARLINHKELHKAAFGEDWKMPHPDKPLILASQQFAEDFGLDTTRDATIVDGRWQLKGLQGDRLIYKVQLH